MGKNIFVTNSPLIRLANEIDTKYNTDQGRFLLVTYLFMGSNEDIKDKEKLFRWIDSVIGMVQEVINNEKDYDHESFAKVLTALGHKVSNNMEDFKRRMCYEHAELKERLTKLNAALGKDDFREKVGDYQYKLMVEQAQGMDKYLKALEARMMDMGILEMPDPANVKTQQG